MQIIDKRNLRNEKKLRADKADSSNMCITSQHVFIIIIIITKSIADVSTGYNRENR